MKLASYGHREGNGVTGKVIHYTRREILHIHSMISQWFSNYLWFMHKLKDMIFLYTRET